LFGLTNVSNKANIWKRLGFKKCLSKSFFFNSTNISFGVFALLDFESKHFWQTLLRQTFLRQTTLCHFEKSNKGNKGLIENARHDGQ